MTMRYTSGMESKLQDEITVKAEAERLVASVPLMPEIQAVDVELYTDHTGDPSLRLVFHMRPGVKSTSDFMHRFLVYKARVQDSILYSDLGRFPYTRLQEAA